MIQENDSEIFTLVEKEEARQKYTINLIASENYVSANVMKINGSILTNKYSEGYPGARYYGGCEFVDQIENICKKRALELFDLDESEWGVNVQALSGSPANFAIYTALIGPGKRIMGLHLPCGGHLTHGFQSATRKVSASSLYFESMPYHLNRDHLMDYDMIHKQALEFKPHMLVCGASAYSRDFDYKRLKEIADEVGAFLLSDVSHISGFIAAKLMNDPFLHSDVVMTTTHKILRGPRGALIFGRKVAMKNGKKIKISDKIDQAIFPGLQGGPHQNSIGALAVALGEANAIKYKLYAEQVMKNAQYMSTYLQSHGYQVLTGGTSNHLFLLDFRNKKINGNYGEKICDLANIIVNKNILPCDTDVWNPKGIRLGTCALTTRGLKEEEIKTVCDLFDAAIQIGETIFMDIQREGNTSMERFVEKCNGCTELAALKDEVVKFITKFPIFA